MTMRSNDPIDILACTIYGEARGLGRSGMAAVASCILNRVAHPAWWGNSVVSVCLEPAQFSCWNLNDPNRAKLLAVNSSDTTFCLALGIADDAIMGRLQDATLGGNSYFDASIVPPYWAVPSAFTASVETLRFYRLDL